MDERIVVSCGLGVDSTALLVLLKQQSRPPDLVIFADTGGEKPETYHFKQIIEQWLIDNGFPALVTVKNSRTRKGKTVYTLEEDCLVGGKLPDIAYGKKGCSITWKKEPVHRYVREWAGNASVKWLIAFNADEKRRINPSPEFEYPLIDNAWDRKRCLKEIAESGLPIPAKSACFFCPSSQKAEIRDLARVHPDLAQRAIAIEKSASERNTNVSGLGRCFSWESVILQEQQQDWLFASPACFCVEAGVDIENYWRQFNHGYQ